VFNLNVPYLIRGKSQKPADGGCIMQVVDWVSTNGWTDQPLCVDATLRDHAIAVNDFVVDEQRQRLLDFVPRLLNTWIDDPRERDRVQQALAQRWNAEMMQFNSDFPDQGFGNWSERSERIILVFEALLDLYDELMGRPKSTEQVDLSALCALQTA
jgi:hypothetical protein